MDCPECKSSNTNVTGAGGKSQVGYECLDCKSWWCDRGPEPGYIMEGIRGKAVDFSTFPNGDQVLLGKEFGSFGFIVGKKAYCEHDLHRMVDPELATCPDCSSDNDTKRKHTPGPWDALKLAHCTAIQAGPDNRICTMWHHVEYDGSPCGSIESQNKTEEEIDANIALIAAAPDMLEALHCFLNNGNTERAEERARAAIAKAEGRET